MYSYAAAEALLSLALLSLHFGIESLVGVELDFCSSIVIYSYKVDLDTDFRLDY